MRIAFRSPRLVTIAAVFLVAIAARTVAVAGSVTAQAPSTAAAVPPNAAAKLPSIAAVPPSIAAKPPSIETATSRWGAARVFRASYAPSVSPVPLIALHSWTIHVTDAANRPVDGAELTVVGAMPEHTHGLPTVPQVTALGGGDYRVDGLKFHMPGRWSVIVRIVLGRNDIDLRRSANPNDLVRSANESDPAHSATPNDSVRFDFDVR